MNIAPIQGKHSQPQFQAIRRVKCSTEQFKLLDKFGAGLQKEIDKGERIIFKNKSIEYTDVSKILLKEAEKQGASFDWIVLNSRRHGIDIPDIDLQPVYDFTGSDLLSYHWYKIKNALSFKPFLSGYKSALRAMEDGIPEHLLGIKAAADYAEARFPKFEKFLTKHKVEDISFENYLEEFEKLAKKG